MKGRLLAIDWGDRRVGLAVSDPSGTIASPAGFVLRRAGKRPPIAELVRRAQELGGSMEYVHGAGIRLAHLMPEEHGEALDVIRRIKAAIDPAGILNPNKLGL